MGFKRWLFISAICLLCVGVMAGCDSPHQPAMIIDSTVTPTPQVETPTDIPEPITPLPEPAETPEPGPAIPSKLTEVGPWLVYAAVDGVYGINMDGSGLTKLYANGADSDVESIRIAAAPVGGKIAVLQVDAQDRLSLGLPRLKTFWLPDGYLVLDTWLIPYEWEAETYVGNPEEMSDQDRYDFVHKMPLEQLFAAIGPWNEIAWSEDSSLLAFNAVFDGTSADLYLYNDSNYSITQLTDGPNHSVDPVFTPDDANILHGAVKYLNWGMSGGGYDYLNVWAANVHDGEVEKVFDHEFFGWERILGWLNDTTYVAVSYESWYYYFDLRIMDVHKGQQKLLYSGHHTAVAAAPKYGRALISVQNYGPDGVYETELDLGVYLLDINYGTTTLIPEIDYEKVIEIQYNSVSDAFYVSERTGKFYVVQMDGSVQNFDALEKEYETYISPDGSRWVFWKKYSDTIAAGNLEGLFDVGLIARKGEPIWLLDSSGVLFLVTTNNEKAELVRLAFPEEGDEMLVETLAEDLPVPFSYSETLVLVEP